jgi:hypothetical protein
LPTLAEVDTAIAEFEELRAICDRELATLRKMVRLLRLSEFFVSLSVSSMLVV